MFQKKHTPTGEVEEITEEEARRLLSEKFSNPDELIEAMKTDMLDEWVDWSRYSHCRFTNKTT